MGASYPLIEPLRNCLKTLLVLQTLFQMFDVLPNYYFQEKLVSVE